MADGRVGCGQEDGGAGAARRHRRAPRRWRSVRGAVASAALVVGTLGAATVLAPAAGADGAATLYASSSGSGTSCTTSAPCSLTTAVTKAETTTGTVTITLAAGTYTTQVTITGGKFTSLTVQGPSSGTPATIAPTSLGCNTTGESPLDTGATVAALVLVTGVTTVNIDGLVVTGHTVTSTTCPSSTVERWGIAFQTASGTVKGNDVTAIVPTPGTPAKNGTGTHDTGIVVETTGSSRSVQISTNTVSTFEKNGISCLDPGDSCTITSNTVTGRGPTDHIAQNGILVGIGTGTTPGASGTVTGNTLATFDWTGTSSGTDPQATYAAGILLYGAATTTTVAANTLTNDQIGVESVASNATIGGTTAAAGNTISETTTSAIPDSIGVYAVPCDIFCTGLAPKTGSFTTAIEHNSITGIPQSYAGSTPTVVSAGIWVGNKAAAGTTGSDTSTISDNTVAGGFLGIFVGPNSGGATSAISGNTVSGFEKNGITANGALGGSSVHATITTNEVTGTGATPNIAQNGIQIANGATGTVTHNTVATFDWTGTKPSATDPQATYAAGILLYGAATTTTVAANTLTNDQIGIESVASNATVGGTTATDGNTISETGSGIPDSIGVYAVPCDTFCAGLGITPGGAISTTIEHNHISGIPQSYAGSTPTVVSAGIWVGNTTAAGATGSDTSTIADNTVTGGFLGIIVGPNSGDATSAISGNTVSGFEKNGITAGSFALGGEGVDATITTNTVTGAGTPNTDAWAQNGIQIANGGTGAIENNTLSGFYYTGGTTEAAAVDVFDASTVTVSANTITDSQLGVAMQSADYGTAANWTMTGDTVERNTIGFDASYKSPPAVTGETAGTWGIWAAAYCATCAVSVIIDGNVLRGTTATSADGIQLGDTTTGTGAGSVTATVTDNAITGWTEAGVDEVGTTTGTFSASVTFDELSADTVALANTSGRSTTAVDDWWGCATGPTGVAGCGTVTVTGAVTDTPYLASVSTSPASQTLLRGANAHVTATLLDGTGAAVTTSPLTFDFTTTPGVGSVIEAMSSGSASFTDPSAGGVTVTAAVAFGTPPTASGLEGTASASVIAPPPPGPVPPTPPATATHVATGSSATPTGSTGTVVSTDPTAGVTATATASGAGAVTVSQLTPTSVATPPPAALTVGALVDVRVASGSSFSTLTEKICGPTVGTTITWYDTTTGTWKTLVPSSGPTLSTTTPPCVTFSLDATSSPTIAQLTGTTFAVGTALPPPVPVVTRVAGPTADATAAAEFTRAFDYSAGSCPSSRTAVVATTAVFQDALSSQFLAQSLTTGTLLTPTLHLSQVTATTLREEGITTVDIVGGTLAVSATVASAIGSLSAYECGGTTPTATAGTISVRRIFGQSAEATAMAVAEHVGAAGTAAFPGAYATTNGTGGTGRFNDTAGLGTAAPAGVGPTAILASGTEFQDAQSASVVAYRTGLPLLLTPASTLSPTAVAAIEKLGVTQVILMGGPAAVTNTVEAALVAQTGVSVLRVAGQDATDTARELARFEAANGTGGLGWTPGHRIMVARGNGFTDGLAGAVLENPHNTATGPAGTARPLLLTESPTAVGGYLTTFLKVAGHAGIDATSAKTLSALTVLGGTLAVSGPVVAAMQTALGH